MALCWNQHEKTKEVVVGGWVQTGDMLRQDTDSYFWYRGRKAFVVLTDPHLDSSALAEELKVFVKQRIAPYKYPRWLEFVPALPTTATGKIQRFKRRA